MNHNNKLRVIAVPDRMVLDVDAMLAGVKRYIGYDLVNDDWVISGRIVEVENCRHYRKAISRGDLKEVVELPSMPERTSRKSK